MGKYHEQFAGMRIVIEFKYFSNSELKKDTLQIAGYVAGLKEEYPEAKVSQYVIYCFGNRGFKVFDL